MNDLKGQHFLTLQDYSALQLESILDLAFELKARQKEGLPRHLLKGKTLAMIFQKPSTRTRVSFEVGMLQLGGHALFLSSGELQMGRGEPIKDTATVLSRYVDGIMIRTSEHSEVEELAHYATVPVINGLTNLLHPCQALSDLLTIKEKLGYLQGVKIAYVGDGNNVTHSLLLGCSKMGMFISVGAPEGYHPQTEITNLAKENADASGGSVKVLAEPAEAVKDAQVIYTDVWASMGQEMEKNSRKDKFGAYQVNEKLLSQAAPDAIVMHCLPAYREEEISTRVLEGEHSVVLDQAENRLHAQKALMTLIL